MLRDKKETTGKRPKGRGMIIPIPWSLTTPPMAKNAWLETLTTTSAAHRLGAVSTWHYGCKLGFM